MFSEYVLGSRQDGETGRRERIYSMDESPKSVLNIRQDDQVRYRLRAAGKYEGDTAKEVCRLNVQAII